jgi:uncharacterized protein YndB with AHSA1/START domain
MMFAIIVIVLLVGFVAAAQSRPDTFSVTRKAAIAAPAADVFAQVNDLHKWDAWSPWAKLDPNQKSIHSGAQEGVGAALTWSGNSKVGEGTMTITESKPAELIRIKLEFRRPFTATNAVEFTFTPEGGKTLVSWNMSGKNNFMGKAMGLVMNCDDMIGKQYDKGLSQLAAVVEKK